VFVVDGGIELMKREKNVLFLVDRILVHGRRENRSGAFEAGGGLEEEASKGVKAGGI